MVREGAPTMSLFALGKDVDADRSLCPGLDPGIGMTGQRDWRVEFNGRWYNATDRVWAKKSGALPGTGSLVQSYQQQSRRESKRIRLSG
jgi:hypothetical protein